MPHLTLTSWLLPAMVAVFFTAAFQGTTGFGMALLGVPALALLIDPSTAVECITFVSIGTAAAIAYSYRKHWDLRRAAWLGVPLLAGTPLGVYVMKLLTNAQIGIGIGVLLIVTSGAYVIGFLLQRGTEVKKEMSAAPDCATDGGIAPYSRTTCLVVGGTSGVMGGATGMTGPLLANYLIRTGISRESFKVTLNLIFTASALWRAGIYVGTGMIEGRTLLSALLLMPVALLGTLAGMRMDKRIPAEQFIRVVHVLLLGLGTWFVIAGCRKP